MKLSIWLVITGIILVLNSGMFCDDKKSKIILENKVLIETVERTFKGELFPELVIKVEKEEHKVYVDEFMWDMRPDVKNSFVSAWAEYFDVVRGIEFNKVNSYVLVYNESNRLIALYEKGVVTLIPDVPEKQLKIT